MRFDRRWPDGDRLEVAEDGARVQTRRIVLRPLGAAWLRLLVVRARPRGPVFRSTATSAVPGPAERSAGWEVRTHEDLLYFLHGGRPRFVMSETMAQRGHAAIAALLAGEQYADVSARSSVPVPLVVEAQSAPARSISSSTELALRREARLARFAAVAAAPRTFLGPAVLAASFVVLAIALLAAGVVTPRLASRATVPASAPASAPVMSLGASPAPPAVVPATTPVLAPSNPIAAPKRSAALHYVRTRRPVVRATSESEPSPPPAGVAHIFPVYPPARFIVVSGSLPLGVAVRRASALVEVGLAEVPRVMALGTTRATLYYGGFSSNTEAQSLATRVRSLGYTATVISE